MKTAFAVFFLLMVPSAWVRAQDMAALPKDVPPVVANAVLSQGSEKWGIDLFLPQVVWKVVGEQRPKGEWPVLQVDVKEVVLKLTLDYSPESALAEEFQSRVVDLNGRRMDRAAVGKRLDQRTPVLVSISGRMPDAYYLQCTRPDTLVVILGIPDSPAPQYLPREWIDE